MSDLIDRQFEEIVVESPNPDLCSYPEYKGKPYYSIHYTENGKDFIGYGTYNPEVLSNYLKEYFMPSAQPDLQQTCNQLAADCNTHKALDALDCISRQAAIEDFTKWQYQLADCFGEDYSGVSIVESAIKSLEGYPSAQPQTCEGCKHFNKWENEVENGYPSPCTRCKRRVGDHYER